MVVTVTDATFEEEVLKADLPVLVDCYADWCGPCKMMAPVLEKMSELYGGKMKFCKINVDDNQEAIAPYRVMSIPNFLFFRNGEVVKNVIGGMAPKDFEANIKAVLG
ncbi:MAG: thioredoxin [Lachnospiraceae bacterium]|nr:thioredoxin [Lachnospiraceae bacterium]